MSTDPRQVPRFIPTLTEVVDPATLGDGLDGATTGEQALVEDVMRQLRPVFERRLQQEYEQLVQSLVTEPWNEVNRRLHGEMEQLVAKTVTDHLQRRSTAIREECP